MKYPDYCGVCNMIGIFGFKWGKRGVSVSQIVYCTVVYSVILVAVMPAETGLLSIDTLKRGMKPFVYKCFIFLNADYTRIPKYAGQTDMYISICR